MQQTIDAHVTIAGFALRAIIVEASDRGKQESFSVLNGRRHMAAKRDSENTSEIIMVMVYVSILMILIFL